MGLLASIVDWDALLQMLWTASAAGIGATAVFGLAIIGATRAVDSSRAGRPLDAVLFGILCAAALALVGAAIVFGIIVMTQK
jgi:hypothetical protein